MNYLTIEFSGICTLVTTKDKKNAQVWLVDVERALANAGKSELATKHSAMLSVWTPEKQSFSSNRTVSVAGNPREFAVWDLAGKRISFDLGSQTALSFPKSGNSKRDQNIGKLVPLNKLCFQAETAQLLPQKSRLVSCVVDIPGGDLTALGANKRRKYEFKEGDKTTTGADYAPRFALRLPFTEQATITIADANTTSESKPVVLKFKKNTSLSIGNLCQEVGSQKNHFYAHFTLLDGGSRPEISRHVPKAKRKVAKVEEKKEPGAFYPFWEYCMVAMMVIAHAAGLM